MVTGPVPSVQQAMPPYFVQQEDTYIIVDKKDNSYEETWQYIVSIAKPYFGRGYKYGAKNINGPIDCSGFTRWLCIQLGTDIGSGTYSQLKAGEEVQLNEQLEPGYIYFVICKGSGPSGRHVYIEGPNGIKMDSSSSKTLDGAKGIGIRHNTHRKILTRRRIPIKDFIKFGKIGSISYLQTQDGIKLIA